MFKEGPKSVRSRYGDAYHKDQTPKRGFKVPLPARDSSCKGNVEA